MTYNKNETKLIIRAHGFGFIFLSSLLTIMILAGLVSLVTSFMWFNRDINLPESILIIFAILIGEPLLIYEIVNLFKKSKVVFIGNVFLTPGQNKNNFPRIEQDCKDIMSYKLTSKYAAQCIEFTFANGKKSLFHTMQFSKKQNMRILSEIKKTWWISEPRN